MAYGFHDFATSETPGATDFDGIMRQTIMTFADATARDAALTGGILAAGLVAQTLDNETFWRYDGAGWEILLEPAQGWAPTITQGSPVAHTLEWATYQRTYRQWVAGFQLTFTGSGSAGNQIAISPPFATIGIGGNFTFYDSSLGLIRTGTVLPGDGGSIALAIDLSPGYYGLAASDGITADDTLIVDMHGAY